jgi:VanZ family protein
MFALMNKSTRLLLRYSRVVAVLLLALIAGALFIGGAQPIAVNLIPAPWDKFAHIALFAVISAATGLASGYSGVRMVLLAVTGALLLGLLDEWHQGLLPGRNAGLDDLAADFLGALAGALGLVYHQRVRTG